MNREMMVLKADNGDLIQVWSNSRDGWEFSKDAKCYIRGEFNNPPSMYCLGERMIHADFGLDSYGVVWTGSTDKDWHGYSFGSDLTKALKWIRECKYPELGCEAWGTLKEKWK